MIANLFLYYAFDAWMTREFPGIAFERYLDDAVIHCASEQQAREVLAALQARMSEVGLALHPDKTRIVYCQDARRRGSHEHTSFTFLGYGFRARRVRTRSGRITTGFVPAISTDALNKISSEVRSWRLHTRSHLSESDLARRINPVVRGWMNYYGAFYPSAPYPPPGAHQRLLAALAAQETQTAAGTTHGTRRVEKGREATAAVLRALGLGHLDPRRLVTRTTRAV